LENAFVFHSRGGCGHGRISTLLPDISMKRHQSLAVASVILVVLLALSGARPYDRTTWLLEVFPILIVLPILWATYRRFPLTSLLYACIFLHAIVLMIGGAYTYARVPIGFQLADLLHLSRNPYDKIGHLFQGFVPALAAREILIRGQYVHGKKMLSFIVVCIVLAISAMYELVEWAVAVALGQGADEFLGTQGDPWDTQSDMFFALIGTVVALLLFSRIHNRQLERFRPQGTVS
jgi:putative membrane protein